MTGRRLNLLSRFTRHWARALLLLSLGMALAPQRARACAACFGQSDSPMAKGMNMGILSLLIVVVFVLGGIAAFFIYLVKRSSAAAATTGPQTLSPASQQIVLTK
jgi:hypothetical protein